MSSPLVACGKPLFFKAAPQAKYPLVCPEPRLGVSVRLVVRSLSEMQKEALVVSSDDPDLLWRLSSDEGPYLNGDDVAPCPLSFFTVGMLSSYLEEILALAKQRKIALDALTLVQDNFYTMEGSALKGTMTGGALPIHLEAKIASPASDSELHSLVADAIAASPLNGLMRRRRHSLFTLTHNGRAIDLGRVRSLDRAPEPDPGDRFDALEEDGVLEESPILKVVEAAEAHPPEALAANKASSLRESQKRTLHVRASGRLRADGLKEILQELFHPQGSTFRYLSEEAPKNGGRGRAPDALSYVSAGIGFCFMTQFGRYARIARKDLRAYRIVQDTHFTRGGASGGTGKPGDAEAVETHVFLETGEDDAFARRILDMAEQTCFLHAFCRTELKTRFKISRVAR